MRYDWLELIWRYFPDLFTAVETTWLNYRAVNAHAHSSILPATRGCRQVTSVLRAALRVACYCLTIAGRKTVSPESAGVKAREAPKPAFINVGLTNDGACNASASLTLASAAKVGV